MIEIIQPAKNFKGSLTIPGDKSISHRALMFGGLAQGTSKIKGLQEGEDVLATARCFQQLGAKISKQGDITLIEGLGGKKLLNPSAELDCANSGTTMRVLMGILAGIPGFKGILIGDASLSKRPMKRVYTPLELMGAKMVLREGNFSPLVVDGQELRPIEYELKIASAQIKTAVMMAALNAKGLTRIFGEIESRDHTERMLEGFGGKVIVNAKNREIIIAGPQQLKAAEFDVPGDPSTAAFWVAAATMLQDSELKLSGISLNPTRIGFMEVLKRSGAHIKFEETVLRPEPMGNILVKSAKLKAFSITAQEVPSLIDEIPMLAVLATQCLGRSEIRGAEELRVKESDRIESVALNLRAMGVKVETYPDGLAIEGPCDLQGATIKTFHDHRIAMAFAVAGLLVKSGVTTIEDAHCAAVSYPQFYHDLRRMAF
jgi:3-phosphoshikimate 1-carboxyvinyltransferase